MAKTYKIKPSVVVKLSRIHPSQWTSDVTGACADPTRVTESYNDRSSRGSRSS